MKKMGKQITQDGAVEWRNNGGIIERRFMYSDASWETVANTNDCPKTAIELKFFCIKGGFKYEK